MKVVGLPQTNLADVALQLRKMAEWIETSEMPYVTCVLVMGMPDQDVRVYGFGQRTSGLEIQGWLTRAQHHVAGNVERFQGEDGAA